MAAMTELERAVQSRDALINASYPLVQRAHRAEHLLKRLARDEGVYEPLYGMCVYCQQGSMMGSDHASDCPWLEARQYLGQYTASDSAARHTQ